MAYLLAIDAGTGSVRSILFDTLGNQIATSSREWHHLQDPNFAGSMGFDCKNNWTLCIQTIKDTISKAGILAEDIAALSTTSMREGIVLYDEEGREIWACANVDSRANDEASELRGIKEDIEKQAYYKSGQTFALGALPRILWVKNNLPDIYEKVKYVNMINDWLIYKLTGIFCAEPSNACTAGIFNLEKRCWETSIAKECGLKDDIFPSIYECMSVVGKVQESAVKETGLSSSTLVVSGGGDAQLGLLGVGVVEDKQAAVFGGSFWQMEYNTKGAKVDKECRIRVNCAAVPQLWNYEAIAFYPGLIMRWYRDAFCQLEKEIEARTGLDTYIQMDEKAAEYPAGSYGVLCAFSDVMDYIAWRHASPTFTNFGIDFKKFNRYTFYRAIMENAAFVTRGHKELIEQLTGDSITEIVFANGASKSGLWCQIVADVLNVTVKTPVVKESTALGAALCAAVGAGIYKTPEEASKIFVKWDKEYTPNLENVEIYRKLYESWRNIYEAQLRLADLGVTEHMWKAPGI